MTLRALTLIQPMAQAIVWGTKRIENRPRAMPKAMRGAPTVVAVHAGKQWYDNYGRMVHHIDGNVPKQIENGGLIGVMLLTGVAFTERKRPTYIHKDGAPRVRPWWAGPYGYEIAHAEAFPEVIPCRGMQGWWPVPIEIEQRDDVRLAILKLLDRAPSSVPPEPKGSKE